ncbi:MAG: hypothetical protein LBS36_12360 [Oscillospiraceae bacterium]|nr:hypothetical protein [Oscillospiraceae bacterium]
MKKVYSYLSLRIEPELLQKFKYVACYDGRSMNAALVRLVRGYVARFEKEHGAIAEKK